MEKFKKISYNDSGITLIALIITIIILLILVGITISSLIGNGLFQKAKQAREESIKAQYEEELNLTIMTMKTDSIYKGEEFNMLYIIQKLPEYLDMEGKVDNYEWDITQNVNEPEGVYKEYIFYIDDEFVAHIDGKVIGIKPEINAEITTEYIEEGNENTVQIQVIASVAEGEVNIIEPEGIIQTIKKIDTKLKKVYIYTVDKNADYTFIAQAITELGEYGRKSRCTVNVNSIIEKPRISASTDTIGSLTINVENDYKEDDEIKYTYYLNGGVQESNSTQKSFTINNLMVATAYKVKVMISFGSQSLESDEITVTTIKRPAVPKINVEYEDKITTVLNYPILTTNGMMNCKIEPSIGSEISIEITSKEEGVINYYTLDGGVNWHEYTGKIQTQYQEEGKIQAKSENINNGLVSNINKLKNYIYDNSKTCVASDALPIEAYDEDYNTYYSIEGGICKFDVDTDVHMAQANIAIKDPPDSESTQVVIWRK